MSPCCVAAAAATAVTASLVVAGLSVFVLVTDALGLAMLGSMAGALALRQFDLLPDSPELWYGFAVLLSLRAARLLSTSRRSLVTGAWRFARAKVAAVAARNRKPGTVLTLEPPRTN